MTSSSDCPLISILVPIYNVERYLRQCLDSICRQTLQDIEIICINDGSTDSSLDIIKEFADQDARIIIIDKPNSGYGDSMNQGLKTARGKYIGIVESDDWVDQEAFKSLYLLAEAYDVEVVRANYYRNKGGKDEKEPGPGEKASHECSPFYHDDKAIITCFERFATVKGTGSGGVYDKENMDDGCGSALLLYSGGQRNIRSRRGMESHRGRNAVYPRGSQPGKGELGGHRGRMVSF